MAATVAATVSPAPGNAWTSPSTGMEFVWISGMALWVGKYEVANGEYRKFRPAHDSGQFGGHSLDGDRQPVVAVGFVDAYAYAAWLSEQDADAIGDAHYRLPSEDEWLDFARCGDRRVYPWGDAMPPAYGNYHGIEGADAWDKIADFDDGHPVTCPVEESGENDWELCGVGGNVWEATAKASAPNEFAAWRGASWADGVAYALRCTTRDDGSGAPGVVNGFRLVLAPEGRAASQAEGAPPSRASSRAYMPPPEGIDNLLQYTIQDGDTWQGISHLFVVTRDSLLRINREDGYEDPTPGRRIWIPPAEGL
jgi:formylglycine-generating enzyme required for sulfatase activity